MLIPKKIVLMSPGSYFSELLGFSCKIKCREQPKASKSVKIDIYS